MATRIKYNNQDFYLNDNEKLTFEARGKKMRTDIEIKDEGGAAKPPVIEPITITENGFYPVPKGAGTIEEGGTYTFKSYISDEEINEWLSKTGQTEQATIFGSTLGVDGLDYDSATVNSSAIGGAEFGNHIDVVINRKIISYLTPAYIAFLRENEVDVPDDVENWANVSSDLSIVTKADPPTVTIPSPSLSTENFALSSIFFDIETKSLDGWGDITVNVAGGGTGDGSIINVIELPTENIDENAIYKKAELEVYLVEPGYPTESFKQVMYWWGSYTNVAVTIVKVDELPETMTPTNLEPDYGENLHAYIYITENDGIAYIYPVSTSEDMPSGLMTVGEFIWGYEDKGWTEDVNSETEAGIYCGASNDKITHYLYKDGNWVELVSEEHIPIIKPLTITKGGVYEATHLDYNTEVKFKDIITEADFKAYIANARISGDDGERIFYVIADSIAVMQAEIPGSPSIYMILQDFSDIGYVLNGAAWDLSDGWQNLDSGEPADAPIITIPQEAYMSADLDTTAIFFDVEKIDAYCPIIVDVASDLTTLNITKNGTYECLKTTEIELGGQYIFKDSYTDDELKTLYDNGEPDWGAESTYINSSSKLIEAHFNLSIRNINDVYFIEYYAYDDSFGFVYATEAAAASGEVEQITEPGWFDRNDMVKVNTPSITLPSDPYFIVDLNVLTPILKLIDGWNKVTVNVIGAAGDADKFFEGGYADVLLPNATKIKDKAFYSDMDLQSVELPKATIIGTSAFNDCPYLTTVNMPSVEQINTSAFENCYRLAHIELSNELISINSRAFFNCENLALTELPSGLTNIGDSAFSGCENLALTELPSGLTDIGSRTFYNCPKLALTELPNGLIQLGLSTFSNCTNLALTKLPSGVTYIGNEVFYQCPNLALTELPSGVTEISSSAFYDCSKLALTELPDGLTIIGPSAFHQCQNLALTELPSGLTSIGSSAFQSCNNLTTLTFKGTPKSIGSNAFRYCFNLKTINVPWAEGEVKNAPWGAPNATINYNYTGDAAE